VVAGFGLKRAHIPAGSGEKFEQPGVMIFKGMKGDMERRGRGFIAAVRHRLRQGVKRI
jgi:hypothetical protein